MKVTVCELPDDRAAFADAWRQLLVHARATQSELVLLPEMPFCRWFADSPHFDAGVWQAAVRDHDEWEHRLREFAPAVIVGTRPVDFGNERYNEGFVWDAEHGSRAAHAKAFLPDEPGVWEASWYNRATPEFVPFDLERTGVEISLGFLICTELWAMNEVRLYGEEGVQLLLTPRSTGIPTHEMWLAGGRVAAIVAGAYAVSSNRRDETGVFAGHGWIIDPDGNILGLTDRGHPFITMELDLAFANQPRRGFPRCAAARGPGARLLLADAPTGRVSHAAIR